MRDERKESRHRASVAEGGKFEDKSTSSYVDLAKTVPLPILVGVHVVEVEIGN